MNYVTQGHEFSGSDLDKFVADIRKWGESDSPGVILIEEAACFRGRVSRVGQAIQDLRKLRHDVIVTGQHPKDIDDLQLRGNTMAITIQQLL